MVFLIPHEEFDLYTLPSSIGTISEISRGR